MVAAVDFYIKNPSKPSPSHSISFYKCAHLLLQELRQAHGSHAGCTSFLFSEFLQVEVPTTPTRGLSIETRSYNTIRLFDYIPLDKAGLYITKEIIHKLRLVSIIGKKSGFEEMIARWSVVMAKDARQKRNAHSKSLILNAKIIIINPNDNKGQEKATKHGSGPMVSFQTSKDAKKRKKGRRVRNISKDASKDSHATEDSSLEQS